MGKKGPISWSILKGKLNQMSLNEGSLTKILQSTEMVGKWLGKLPIKEVAQELIVIGSDRKWSGWNKGRHKQSQGI